MNKKTNKNQSHYISNLFYLIYNLLLKFPILLYIRLLFFITDYILCAFIIKPNKTNNTKKKVCIIYPFALGDAVIFCWTAKQYRKLFPAKEYELSIICQKSNAPLFYNIFDKIIECEFTKASVNILERYKILKKIRQNYYDIVIDPEVCNFCTPNIFIVNACSADNKIGFFDDTINQFDCPKRISNHIYNEIYNINQSQIHRVNYYEQVLKKLGLKDVSINSNDIFSRKTIPFSFLPSNYYVLFPGASIKKKKWPLERFIDLIYKIQDTTNLSVVLCGTQHDETEVSYIFNTIKEKVNVINLLNKTTIFELAEVIKNAKFLITNETSAYHIGLAVGTNTIAICGGTNLKTFMEYKKDYIYGKYVIATNYCKYRDCRNYCKFKYKTYPPCFEKVTSTIVFEKLKNMI